MDGSEFFDTFCHLQEKKTGIFLIKNGVNLKKISFSEKIPQIFDIL